MIEAEQSLGSVIFCCLLLGMTGCFDVMYRKIPNRITIPACVTGFLYHVWYEGFHSGALLSLNGCAIGFFILLIPYLLGVLGGGDVKLFAALGSWLGGSGVLNLALYATIAGGLAGLIIIIRAIGFVGLTSLINFPGHLNQVLPAKVRTRGIPYAAPVAAGYVAYLFIGPLV